MNKESLKYAVAYSSIFSLYLFVYGKHVVVIFGYMGYQDNFSVEKVIVSFFALMAICFLINNNRHLLNFFTHLIIGLVLIPTLVIFSGSDLPYLFIIITISGILTIAMSQRLIKFKAITLISLRDNRYLLNILTITSVLVVGSIFFMGGGSYFNLDISQVYEFRDDAAENLPGIFAYITPIITKVIIPLTIVLAFANKNWLKTLILLLCALLFFGLTGHKSMIFYPLVALFFYKISKRGGQIKFFIVSLFFIGIISLLEFSYLSNSDVGYWFSSLIFRRALLTPALLNWYYIDWFSANDLYYWADSRLTLGLISSPSHMSSPFLIGYQYYGSDDMSANAGWIGSGFSNGSFIGVIIYSIFIGLLVSILNAYSKKLGAETVISCFSIIFITIIMSADFITSLLTHGLIFAIFLLIIIGGVKTVKVNENIALDVRSRSR